MKGKSIHELGRIVNDSVKKQTITTSDAAGVCMYTIHGQRCTADISYTQASSQQETAAAIVPGSAYVHHADHTARSAQK